MKIDFKFEIGQLVVDIVTSYSGKITAAYIDASDDREYKVESLTNDGLPVEKWFKPGRLTVVEK